MRILKWSIEQSGTIPFLTFLLVLLITLITLPSSQAAQVPITKNIRSFSDLPPGSTPAIVRSMLKELPQEYQIQDKDSTFSLTNPAHDINILFNPEGPRITSGEMNWMITMSGIGYEGFVKPVQAARLVNDDGMMVYERDNVTEWYVNSRWGIEQGFTIHKAPDTVKGKELVVELSLSGNGHPSLADNTVTFADKRGNHGVRYTGLQVIDAKNRKLPARLTLINKTLRILVDDTEARYPVTIDPWFQKAKLTASEGSADDYFGWSVAISGDTVVVGAYGDDSWKGSAYVFVKPESGWATATQIAKLTASDGVAPDHFGHSVAISGDTVVVGAAGDGDGVSNFWIGSAYVFVKPGSGWSTSTQTAKLTASDGVANDSFGYSVAISGDTVVVGAKGDDTSKGSAYVFVKPGAGWATATQTAKLNASDGVTSDQFGGSVAISGDTVVVGASGDDDNGYNSGSAYGFVRPESGWPTTATQTAKFTADDGTANDYFGISVAISGDTAVVGSYWNDSKKGSAYIFVKPVNGWITTTQTAKLTTSDGAAPDDFGYSVAISGDTVVGGAFRDDSDKGSAYVFVRPGSGWATATQTTKFTASDGAPGDYFGISVAISGDTVVVGSYWDDSKKGSAYIFESSEFPWHMFIPAITNKRTQP